MSRKLTKRNVTQFAKHKAKDEGYKVMVVACKGCGKEFEMRIPIMIFERIVAICEEDGEMPIFTGRCPDCQERDPFPKLLKGAGVPHWVVSRGGQRGECVQ